MALFHNFPLMAALLSIVLAQIVKVPIKLIATRSWDVGLGFSTGGMPSSHSAAVVSLATAIGIVDGVSSSGFAIAVIVSAITMYDAMGIRRHAGMHASLINRIARTIPMLHHDADTKKPREELKELLGHRPIEVLAGAFFGAAVSVVYYWIVFG
ncbi:divergent PAP2 family protein [Paenibacillus aurantiacus]|uniref:Divergent PAP2 family protein n=1 Tax=Paenibacillus aurantiacus TaxID=1936118 RepID=A0ABV5KWP2_9BACL